MQFKKLITETRQQPYPDTDYIHTTKMIKYDIIREPNDNMDVVFCLEQKLTAEIVSGSEIDEYWYTTFITILNKITEENMELHNTKIEVFRQKYPDIYIEVDHFNKCVNFKRKLSGLSDSEALRVKVGFNMQLEQVGPQNGTFVSDCMDVAKVYITENIASPNKTLLND